MVSESHERRAVTHPTKEHTQSIDRRLTPIFTSLTVKPAFFSASVGAATICSGCIRALVAQAAAGAALREGHCWLMNGIVDMMDPHFPHPAGGLRHKPHPHRLGVHVPGEHKGLGQAAEEAEAPQGCCYRDRRASPRRHRPLKKNAGGRGTWLCWVGVVLVVGRGQLVPRGSIDRHGSDQDQEEKGCTHCMHACAHLAATTSSSKRRAAGHRSSSAVGY